MTTHIFSGILYVGGDIIENNEIGNRIVQLRKNLDLTQEKFGEPLGVTRSVIVNIERKSGFVAPKPLLLDMICKTYNVNEDWLKNGTGEMFRKPSAEDVIIKAFANLTLSDGDHFKKQFIAALAELDEDAWEAVEAFAEKVVKKTAEAENAEKKDEV